ncbi:MAG: 50S ribosomal protein L25, partial [Myxococcota bacterium]|nr:50S ribosomal protein L25 [Myxococcota bacterium]
MDAITVQAEARTDFGKGAARKIRAAGRVPAVIYRAGEEAAHLTVDPNELQLLYRRSGNPNLIVSLDVGGTKHVCVLKDAQKHPVS